VNLDFLRRLELVRRNEPVIRPAYEALETARLLVQRVGRRAIASARGETRCVALGSQTLGDDDVRLARRALRDRAMRSDVAAVESFEREFARWNGSAHALAFMGGRVALSACIEALGLRPGDEAIVPGYTCVAVPNAFDFAGVSVRYADIELETYGLDVRDVARKVGERTRVILLQHLFGLVCRDYDAILAFARSRGIRVIEDCAHATGAVARGRKVGNAGDVGFMSTEQSKVLNTTQGGIAVTNDPVLGERLARIASAAPFPADDRQQDLLLTLIANYHAHAHDAPWWRAEWSRTLLRNRVVVSTTSDEEQGIRPPHYGQRMAPALAAIGSNQLRKLDRFNARRRMAAEHWRRHPALQGSVHPTQVEGSEPVYVRYPVLVAREQKQDTQWLRDLGVEPGVWFVSNVHPVRRSVPDCPNADIAVERCVNLPTLLPRV